MNARDVLTTEYEQFDVDTPASKLVGVFRETGAKAVVITDDGEYEGVVTPERLSSGHLDPDARAGGLAWHVGRIDVDDDVRTVARTMLGSSATVLPVFEDGELVGAVTAEGLLAAVEKFLGVLTVDDVCSRNLVTVSPDETFGEALHAFRTHGVTHLPVVRDGRPVGVVSVYDVFGIAGREAKKSQGGSPPEATSVGGGRSHGGFGERAGDLDRILDLPVDDVMSSPVETTTADRTLDEAVEKMLSSGVSSLVVEDDGRAVGIVTKRDALRSLTWTGETRLPVQVTNVDLMDDLTRDEIADRIEAVTRKYGALNVLEANVNLHEHDETLRGTPLIQARVRLFTDRGHFVGTGEGYGASHAFRLALNVLERQILEGKEYARTKKHPSEDDRNRVFGWWLSGPSRRR